MLHAKSYRHLALLLLVAVSAFAPRGNAESSSSRGWSARSPSSTGTKCELEIVDGLVRECCKATGDPLPGVNNCTNFMRNFEDFCVKKLGPSRCKAVTVWCPNGGGHSLNMVQLSDGTWYLVEPQLGVYEDYPLSSLTIPEELLATVMPGCGCKYAIDDSAYNPNTDPFVCTGEDYNLWGSGSVYQASPLTPMQSCLTCCANLSIPPRHPNPEWFHEMCRNDCEFSGLELSRADYCAHRYRGEDCEFCCDASFEPVEKCKQKCRPKTPECSPSGGVMWDHTPKSAPNSCAQKGLSSKEACISCCHSESRVCHYRNSMPCLGWRRTCARACTEEPSTPQSSSSSRGQKSSSSSTTTP